MRSSSSRRRGSSAAEPRIEFLWWSGCPSWERALAELRDAMAELGLDPATVGLREIETEADAAALGFPGSPTIRVDGEDVSPPGPERRDGLSCRVYRHRDGRISPLPDPLDVREALERTRA